jgi:protein-S-isoprenylcysteine O-methyltransferase Ste14
VSLAIYARVVSFSWLAFIAIWLFAALVAKPGARQAGSPARALLRMLLVVFAALGLRYGNLFSPITFGGHRESIALAGAVLCVLGLLFATWARFTMGSSWGMPMTVGEETQLVTKGPYAFVRHPIYTGVGAMLIGSALVFVPAVLGAALLLPYFIVSAFREERDMRRLFPDVYPGYMQRTKRLVPFVW